MRIPIHLACFALLTTANEFMKAVKRASLSLEGGWEPARGGGEFVTSPSDGFQPQMATNASFSFSDDMRLIARQRCPIGTGESQHRTYRNIS